MADGSFKLKTSHAYFWQGQLLITGLRWCDFFVEGAQTNIEVKQKIRQKGDFFILTPTR